MNWNFSVDLLPEPSRKIIRCEKGPYLGRTVTYSVQVTNEEMKAAGYPVSEYWWVYEEDFPYPKGIEFVEDKNELD